MSDAPLPPPEASKPVTVPIPEEADTTFSVSNIADETWSQWFRSDKFLLMGLYLFLVFMMFHAAHDKNDTDLLAFMQNAATGAFSGLMVALRGTKAPQK